MKHLMRFDTEGYLKETKVRADHYVSWIDGTIKNTKREETLVVKHAFIYSKAFLITTSRVNSILHASKKPLRKETKLALLKDIGAVYDEAVHNVLGPHVLASSENLTRNAFSVHGSKVNMEHLHDLAFRKFHLVPTSVDAKHEVTSLGLSAWIISDALPTYLSFTNTVHEAQT